MKMLIAAVAAFALTGAALAQPGHGPGQMGHGGPMGEGMPMMGMMQEHCAMMGRTDGALAFLKAELAITPAQTKAWDGFAEVYRANAKMPMSGGQGMKKHGAGPMADKPFPEKIAQHLTMMEAHLAGVRKLADAAKPLYDALSAEQRKTADELLTHFVMSHCSM
ncbi:MAG: Spy/CpxP family protein refolding chaperone [Alphaproteobacteria bacterium]|nr:Spy/CpxP family protein refolding chaperone [Alphaproteobacteria bacterium]